MNTSKLIEELVESTEDLEKNKQILLAVIREKEIARAEMIDKTRAGRIELENAEKTLSEMLEQTGETAKTIEFRERLVQVKAQFDVLAEKMNKLIDSDTEEDTKLVLQNTERQLDASKKMLAAWRGNQKDKRRSLLFGWIVGIIALIYAIFTSNYIINLYGYDLFRAIDAVLSSISIISPASAQGLDILPGKEATKTLLVLLFTAVFIIFFFSMLLVAVLTKSDTTRVFAVDLVKTGSGFIIGALSGFLAA
ncbi:MULTISPECIES: hypothetical protein [unclassified Aureimonas]|uniref:hypothetical protein n=1 Tax=unclassified Aureimonas TaxID=2615206 RepID=UPI000AF08955|nr:MULTISPECIES: hypothetical protein [unclassified Aureimonas]